jgi:hypothetical protein
MEKLSDLYRANPEPAGFRLVKGGGRVLPKVYPTYEQAEQAAKTLGLPINDWSTEPVYGPIPS